MVLAIEMYKIANGLSPEIMIDLMTDLGNEHSTKSNCNVTIETKGRILYVPISQNFGFPASKR